MSIGLWNKDDSAYGRIDVLEKQIADIGGYEEPTTLNIDSRSSVEKLQDANEGK